MKNNLKPTSILPACTIKKSSVYISCILLFATIIFIPLPGSSTAYGEKLISADKVLQKLIDEAMEQNNEIKSLKNGIEANRKKANFQGSLNDPKLGIALLNLPVDDFKLDKEPMTQKQIFIAQKFPWPGKLELKSKVFSIEAEKQIFFLKEKKLEIASSIAEVYYDLCFITESLELNTKLSDLMTLILNNARSKYSSGRGLQKNIFQARVEISLLEDERVQLKKQYTSLENKINALLNRDVYKEITISPLKKPESIKFSLKELKEKVIYSNPSINMLRKEIEKMSTMTAFSEKSVYPDFDIKLAYGQREDSPSGQNREDFISLATTINIPLWKHKRQDKDIMAKKFTELAAEKKYKNMSQSLPFRIETLVSDLNLLEQSYKIIKNKSLPLSHQWAEAAISDYEVGKIDFTEMISARSQPLKLELKSRKYVYNIYKKRTKLEVTIGGTN